MDIKKSYKVLRTLSLAGAIYEIGHVIQMEGVEVKNLILGGFLKEIPMTDEQKSADAAEVKAPENAAADATPVLKKYKVVKEFTAPAVEAIAASEGVEAVEAKPEVKFEIGQEVEMEETNAAPLVAEGVLELVVA